MNQPGTNQQKLISLFSLSVLLFAGVIGCSFKLFLYQREIERLLKINDLQKAEIQQLKDVNIDFSYSTRSDDINKQIICVVNSNAGVSLFVDNLISTTFTSNEISFAVDADYFHEKGELKKDRNQTIVLCVIPWLSGENF